MPGGSRGVETCLETGRRAFKAGASGHGAPPPAKWPGSGAPPSATHSDLARQGHHLGDRYRANGSGRLSKSGFPHPPPEWRASPPATTRRIAVVERLVGAMNPWRFRVQPVTVVNKGASFGPRVASTSFYDWRNSLKGQLPHYRVQISADVDGAIYQDAGAVRRRVARAAVPVGRRAAAGILDGSIAPSFSVRTSESSKIVTAAWLHAEQFEGFERRVLVQASYRAQDHVATDEAPPAVLKTAALTLKGLADELHVAVDDPANRSIFGGK